MKLCRTSKGLDPAVRQALVCLAGSCCLTSLLLIMTPSLLQGVDYQKLHSFYKLFLRERILSGSLPLWNPYVLLGRPFLADVETACFYPPSLLFVLLGADAGFAAATILHVFLAVFSMKILAESWGVRSGWAGLLGFVYVLSGPVLARLQAGQVQYAYAMCWWPLLLWLTCRLQERFTVRGWLALAGALALQFLCGHPQLFWITGVSLALFIVGTRLSGLRRANFVRLAADAARLAGAYLLAFGIAAVQLLPFLELVGEGNRGESSLEFAASFALPWTSWLSLVLPNSPVLTLGWEHYLYPGLLVAIAGFCGLAALREDRIRGLLLLCLVAGLVSLGRRTPLFVAFYYALPGLSLFRIPARLAFPVTASLILAAGCFFSRGALHGWRRVLPIAVVATLASLVVVRCVRLAPRQPAAWGFLAAWLGLLAASLGLLFGLRRALRRPGGKGWIWLICAGVLVMLDLLAGARWSGVTYCRGSTKVMDASLAQFVAASGLQRPNGFPVRISMPGNLVNENSGMGYGFSNLSGYVALASERVWRFLHESKGLAPPRLYNTFPDQRIYTMGAFPYNCLNLQIGYAAAAKEAVVNPDPDPRAFLVHRSEVVENWADGLVRIKDGHDVHEVALVEKEFAPKAALDASESGGSAGTVSLREFRHERIELAVSSPAGGMLVLSEAWFPGWEAIVNGEERACFPVNVWMRGAVVPAGESSVVFRYRSTWLRTGAIVTCLALALWLLLWFRAGATPAAYSN